MVLPAPSIRGIQITQLLAQDEPRSSAPPEQLKAWAKKNNLKLQFLVTAHTCNVVVQANPRLCTINYEVTPRPITFGFDGAADNSYIVQLPECPIVGQKCSPGNVGSLTPCMTEDKPALPSCSECVCKDGRDCAEERVDWKTCHPKLGSPFPWLMTE